MAIQKSAKASLALQRNCILLMLRILTFFQLYQWSTHISQERTTVFSWICFLIFCKIHFNNFLSGLHINIYPARYTADALTSQTMVLGCTIMCLLFCYHKQLFFMPHGVWYPVVTFPQLLFNHQGVPATQRPNIQSPSCCSAFALAWSQQTYISYILYSHVTRPPLQPFPCSTLTFNFFFFKPQLLFALLTNLVHPVTIFHLRHHIFCAILLTCLASFIPVFHFLVPFHVLFPCHPFCPKATCHQHCYGPKDVLQSRIMNTTSLADHSVLFFLSESQLSNLIYRTWYSHSF